VKPLRRLEILKQPVAATGYRFIDRQVGDSRV